MFYTFLRNSPAEAGFPTVRDDGLEPAPQTIKTAATASPAALTTAAIPRLTFSNRILWILGVGFFCMNAVRYSFMNWSVQSMADFQSRSIKGSALTAVAIPLIGSLGAISAGWMSDTLFSKRRAPVCVIMHIGLAAVCVGFTFVPRDQWALATARLGLAGFTMCLGTLVTIFSGAGVGWLSDLAKGDWNLVFCLLAGLVLVAAGFMISIWNARPKGAK